MENNIKVTKDGFVWMLVSDRAKEVYNSNLFCLYVLWDDDSESMINNEDELTEYINKGYEIGIEVGFIYEQNN